MADVAVTNTFTASTTAVASEVNANFNDLVTYINNRNGGSVNWDSLYAATTTQPVLSVNNSTGTNNIADFKDNGTVVVTILDGGFLGSGLTGPTVRLEVVGASNAVATFIKPQGALTDNTDTAGLYVLHQGTAGAAFRVRSDNNLTGTYFSHIYLNNTSSALPALTVETTGTGVTLITNTTGSGKIQSWRNSGSEHASIASNGTAVFNETGAAAADFRVESDTDANIIFVDSSDNKVYFGGTADGAGTMSYTSTGGLQMGNPTGGNKGSGTINLLGDIYKNNTAYTNPDYVFESWVTGKIEKFKDNPGASGYFGLLPLEMLEDYITKNLDLPRVKSIHVDGGGQGMFARADIALEKIEELALYIIQLHNRISKVEMKYA